MTAWSMLAPAVWYVCVTRPTGGPRILVIEKGRIAGTIKDPDPMLCNDAVYEPLHAA
jgi:hypothetical protein